MIALLGLANEGFDGRVLVCGARPAGSDRIRSDGGRHDERPCVVHGERREFALERDSTTT